MRQRHRQRLVAMALAILPTGSDSYSSSASPLSAMPYVVTPKQQQRQRTAVVMDLPNMFLSSRLTGNAVVPTTLDRFGGRALSPEKEDDDTEQHRTLGFDTKLAMSASSLDSQKWNAGSALEQGSPLFSRRSSLSWFPWVPTRMQIDSLKLSELKQACGERGLKKSGVKAELQGRLWEWTRQQRVAIPRRITAMDMGLGLSELYSTDQQHSSSTKDKSAQKPSLKANSLAEWSRDGVDELLAKREKIHREKRQPKPQTKAPVAPKTKPQDYRSYLTKAFEAPSSISNNRQVKELYQAAKAADQAGDREASNELLCKLKTLTPTDGRVLRRLARMEAEQGHVDQARSILQEGVRRFPDNAYLWHGLAQMEVSPQKSRQFYRKAIAADPSLPHSYHALGVMEHNAGKIASAMKILKKGVSACPNNHRLNHALGDIYRDAKMLDMAETAYRRALECGPKVSHCFAYRALAFCAYEQGNVEDCRYWLRKSVSLNDGRHAQGWVALAQMEEAEGNIDAARAVCIGAISLYEMGLVKRNVSKKAFVDLDGDPLAMKETLFTNVPQYRSGDKFINVFRNWARLEQKHGYPETVDEVYTRATFAFPYDWKLPVNWAQYHASVHHVDRARELFHKGCNVAKNRHADPYRLCAEYEMSFGTYEEARKILFRGAKAMSASSDGGLGNHGGMAELYHTWAVCEWHLGNLDRAEVLFDHALRLTESGDNGSKHRSIVLYSVARLEYFRGEYELAQHCIALCLKENLMPGGNSKIWELWAEVASAAGNEALARQCKEQMAVIDKVERDKGAIELYRMGVAGLSEIVGAATQPLMRRDPWHNKLFSSKSTVSPVVELPSTDIFVDDDEEPRLVSSRVQQSR